MTIDIRARKNNKFIAEIPAGEAIFKNRNLEIGLKHQGRHKGVFRWPFF